MRRRMQAAFAGYTFEWAKNGQPACAPGANASTWNGVQCSNGRVSALALHFSSLYGPVSSALGNLSQLTFLILDSNALTGAWAPMTSVISFLVPPQKHHWDQIKRSWEVHAVSREALRELLGHYAVLTLAQAAPLSSRHPVLMAGCCALPRNAARVIGKPQAADLPQRGHELVVRQVRAGCPMRVRDLFGPQDAVGRLESAVCVCGCRRCVPLARHCLHCA